MMSKNIIRLLHISMIIILIQIHPISNGLDYREICVLEDNQVSRVHYVGNNSTYMTIQDALSNSTNGDMIIVGNGTYFESLLINKSNISIVGNSSTEVKIITTINGTIFPQIKGSYGFNIDAENITIKNINITLKYNVNFGINIVKGANITIDNVNINNEFDYNYGIALWESENVTISNCNFISDEGKSQFGIMSFSTANKDLDISYCTFHSYNTIDSNALVFRGTGSLQYLNAIVTGDKSGCFVLIDSSDVKMSNCSGTIRSNNGELTGLMVQHQQKTIINNVGIYANGSNVVGYLFRGADYKISLWNCSLLMGSTGKYGMELHYSLIDVYIFKGLYSGNFINDIYCESSNVRLYYTNISNPYVDSSSKIDIHDSFKIICIDENGNPITGLDILLFSPSENNYATEYYGGTNNKTDLNGAIPFITLKYISYSGSSNGKHIFYQVKIYHSELEYETIHSLDFSRLNINIISLNIHPPSTPVNIVVSPVAGTEFLNISWSVEDDESLTFWIYTNSSGDWNLLAQTDKYYYIDNTLTQNEIKYYKIGSFDGKWTSPLSSAVSGKALDITPPDPPSNLHLISISYDSVTIEWELSDSLDVGEYVIFLNWNFTLSGLQPSTDYRIAVAARDLHNNTSELTDVLFVRTLNDNSSIMFDFILPSGYVLRSGLDVVIAYADDGNELVSLSTSSPELFIGDIPVETLFRVKVIPSVLDRAVIGELSGLLPNDSIELFIPREYIGKVFRLEVILDYYEYVEEIEGVLRGHIHYYMDNINHSLIGGIVYLYMDGELLSNWSLDGANYFEFSHLLTPANYSLRVVPSPEYMAVEGERSGVFPGDFGIYTLTHYSPSREVYLVLDFYEYLIVSFPIDISIGNPSSEIDIDESIVIRFNRTVMDEGLMDLISFEPHVEVTGHTLSDDGMTLYLMHGDLSHSTVYLILINGSFSGPGNISYAPVNLVLSVRTRDAGGSEGGIGPVIVVMIALLVVIVIGAVLFLLMRSRKRDPISTDGGDSDSENFREGAPVEMGPGPSHPDGGSEGAGLV